MGDRLRHMTPQEQLIADHVRGWIKPGATRIIGICGPQASGKTTACRNVVEALTAEGIRIAALSLDDLYLGRAARETLAKKVHPLFVTRGPAGTHDVALGMDVLRSLRRGESGPLPRFSKPHDEPSPVSEWPVVEGRLDLLLFEGWCVGARPIPFKALVAPFNTLERDEDPRGVWRRYWNAHLGGPTATLFEEIDRLIYLRPPSFDVVYQWRCQQEHEMIAKAGPGGAPAAMSDAAIARFIAHYERMTNHLIETLPERADLVINLDAERRVLDWTASATG